MRFLLLCFTQGNLTASRETQREVSFCVIAGG